MVSIFKDAETELFTAVNAANGTTLDSTAVSLENPVQSDAVEGYNTAVTLDAIDDTQYAIYSESVVVSVNRLSLDSIGGYIPLDRIPYDCSVTLATTWDLIPWLNRACALGLTENDIVKSNISSVTGVYTVTLTAASGSLRWYGSAQCTFTPTPITEEFVFTATLTAWTGDLSLGSYDSASYWNDVPTVYVNGVLYYVDYLNRDGTFREIKTYTAFDPGVYEIRVLNCPSYRLKYLDSSFQVNSIDRISSGRSTIANVFTGIAITTLPEDLFSDCPNLQDATAAFKDCESLGSIPQKLFNRCPKLTTVTSLFENTALSALPSRLFAYNTALTKMDRMVYGCPYLTVIPTDLFNQLPGLTTINSIFASCVSAVSIPNGLFDTVAPNVDFTNACKGMSALASSLDTVFAGTVYTPSSVAGLFDGCGGLKGTFSTWQAKLPAYTVVGSYNHAVRGCTQLTDYTTIPTDWK